MTSAFTVRVVSTTADWNGACNVRRAVFQAEQGVPAHIEFDADDERAIHVIAVSAESPTQIIGTARIVLDSEYAHIGRMAVLSTWRRYGVGRALLEQVGRIAAERGVSELVLNAQVHAIPFYERCGFTCVGPVFDEAGIPHREMRRHR